MFPFRKAYKFVKRIFSKKSKPKRKFKKLVKRSISNNVLLVRKVQQDAPITINYGTNQQRLDFGILQDLSQYACYADLYEKFKIVKMVVKFRCLNNVNLGGTINNFNTAGMIHSQIDYTDITNPGLTLADINAMMQDDTYKGTPSTRDHIRTIYPQYVENVDPANNQKSSKGWQNTKNAIGTLNNSTYLGLKTIFQAGYSSGGATSNFMVIPQTTFYIAFKDPR